MYKAITLLTLTATLNLLGQGFAHAFCAGAIVKEIQSIAKKPEVVEAVKLANLNPPLPADLHALDARWIASNGQEAEARKILASTASEFLRKTLEKRVYFKEAILTGKLGETVAMNMVTSDYWQGDEEKFTEIFDTNQPSRKPDFYISRARWDESVKSMISQVSVPVYDSASMIGTLTIGIDLKRVPQQNH
ncbi:hypothetical protein [Limnobacter parvus]|uniref:Uncharacterized protein n=1 Tax=Limnobacter parvus TaxID=2939690 RepID=A0ABT1XLF8_9BURK|nr:hypothetical protein [Limnobacter parvus]MCR2747363.1 hypothetical protein [Limnobacter parvus]